MSNSAGEPGSQPAAVDTITMANANGNVPPSPSKAKASPAHLSAFQQTDRIIIRLSRLLAKPAGLATFLSTFTYTLYLLIYLESKAAPLKSKIYRRAPSSTVGPSRIAALGTLMGSTRTTLRLFGLVPMYAWLRALLQGSKARKDVVLHAAELTQCIMYMTFQFLENVGVLTNANVLPPTWTSRWADKTGRPVHVFLWAYRAWFIGVLCDAVRLGREAQLHSLHRKMTQGAGSEVQTEEEKTKDKKWWSDLIITSVWIPIAMQFSKEGGFPWFNQGIMGVCGIGASLGRTQALWRETDVA